ncbi:hypothetical protein [Desulfosporosinus sp.]|uniref:hypothetical protein n=1 Tax=Desulfosporosinus sp. TaxID=157907 RepID=UPI002605AC5E|nr:hypothetical protein [Desulfosporosinus sp.]
MGKRIYIQTGFSPLLIRGHRGVNSTSSHRLTTIRTPVFSWQPGQAERTQAFSVQRLGFTNVAASGNECVRWSRVHKCLNDFGYSQDVGKEGFNHETLFRLRRNFRNSPMQGD